MASTRGCAGPVAGVRAMQPEAGDGFVSTGVVEELTERALTYLEAGYPMHFAGPAGTGKTTLALHVAAKLGRPVMLIHGDDEFGSSDLVGNDIGYRKIRSWSTIRPLGAQGGGRRCARCGSTTG